ncbi:hypothetical protein EV360DRAFT_80519 [Lentinula raphanica]|nr:hypothetical protein EV360DRAFT_80519 [Lentinula raphanica]
MGHGSSYNVPHFTFTPEQLSQSITSATSSISTAVAVSIPATTSTSIAPTLTSSTTSRIVASAAGPVGLTTSSSATATIPPSTSSIPPSASSTMSPSASIVPSPTPTPSSSTSSQNNVDVAAVTGALIGGFVLVALIIAGILYMRRRRRLHTAPSAEFISGRTPMGPLSSGRAEDFEHAWRLGTNPATTQSSGALYDAHHGAAHPGYYPFRSFPEKRTTQH